MPATSTRLSYPFRALRAPNSSIRFDANSGALIGTFATVGSPAGMNYTNDGRLLVALNGATVMALTASTGALIGALVSDATAAGLQGGTCVIAGAPQVDATQVGTQYWMIGAGQLSGRTIEFDLTSATGSNFGAAFNHISTVRKRWDRIRADFTSLRGGELQLGLRQSRFRALRNRRLCAETAARHCIYRQLQTAAVQRMSSAAIS